jgi:hypothetical protein
MGEVKKTKKGTESNDVKMISVEQANAQMQNVLQQYNAKMQQMNIQMQQMDAMLRDRTVDHLFKVVEYSEQFSAEFVVKCVTALESFLTQVALTEPEKEVDKEEIPTAPVEEV